VTFEEVDALATRYLEAYVTGKLDRLEVVYTKFLSASRQVPVVETLLPLGSLGGEDAATREASTDSSYEFYPSAESILEELVPASFKVKLFKCFLDSAVSEQIARMVAMKAATENAGDLIRQLSRSYNRARQSQITGEIMEIIGGVEALNK
jgi:F-type H+-transporting ATPase subunit gamma